MLNLVFLRSFVAVAEAGSFRGAADALGLAQPTVSQHLRKLEEGLGAALIERGHARCSPTPRGRAALPLARSLLRVSERFEAAARGGGVVIGASGNVADYCLPEALRAFEAETGGAVAWRVERAPNPEIEARLRAGEIDLAVTEWPLAGPGLHAVPWREEPLAVILPPDHPLAGRARLTVDEVLSLPLVGGEPGTGTGRLLRAHFGDRASELRVVASLGSTEAVKRAVAAGLGASLVLRRAVRTEAAAGLLAVAALDGPDMVKRLHAACPDTAPAGVGARRLLDFLAAQP